MPDGVTTGARAPDSPVAAAPAGALVGKIGNGPAFLIGSRNRVQMTAAGQLFLGVNDGHLQDNEGSFQVQVAREGGAVRSIDLASRPIACITDRAGSPSEGRPFVREPALAPRASPYNSRGRPTTIAGYPWRNGKTRSTCRGPTSR